MSNLHSVSVTPASQRVLITGGAGFLGSHLCERLLAQGHEVLCVDNFVTGRLSNIQHLASNPKFKLVRQDIVLPVVAEVDAIYNLACPASPPHYQADPIQTMIFLWVFGDNVEDAMRAGIDRKSVV